jgi:hypothetical protein
MEPLVERAPKHKGGPGDDLLLAEIEPQSAHNTRVSAFDLPDG